MPAPVWRMNGLWRRMAGVLVLCALMLSSEVMCQSTAATTASSTNITAGTTAAPGVDVSPTVPGSIFQSDTSAGPKSSSLPETIILNPDNQDVSTSEKTAALMPNIGKTSLDVKCVGKDDIQKSNAIRAVVQTHDCETTKLIILENATGLCDKERCNVEIFQDGNTMLLTSDDAELSTLTEAFLSGHLKDKLGVTKTESPSSHGGKSNNLNNSSVFVGILVSGLLAALAITLGYLKCQRRSDTKGVTLAEEAYPVDQENQGNTLVSVAPLNPPPETQEKPSINGESPEAAKTQPPPPTNGHSTTKTADTEL
ncbi:putative GPI-anchored protein pfl2 isoform X1 [Siniperca chuatsi]|uniref:putative GPI-anchored protein pfl2 isoform X1 n=1 Tax=Siniperca chuatsi TaxID=119488 RepID=UPI001CE078D0|nr:putative GPI-anchored protein pfl2 isoform X1 [Siniperca chuatsi]